jgi:hypothetical protein
MIFMASDTGKPALRPRTMTSMASAKSLRKTSLPGGAETEKPARKPQAADGAADERDIPRHAANHQRRQNHDGAAQRNKPECLDRMSSPDCMICMRSVSRLPLLLAFLDLLDRFLNGLALALLGIVEQARLP